MEVKTNGSLGCVLFGGNDVASTSLVEFDFLTTTRHSQVAGREEGEVKCLTSIVI